MKKLIFGIVAIWLLSKKEEPKPIPKPQPQPGETETEKVQPRASAVGKINETSWFEVYEQKPFPDSGKFDKRITAQKGKAGVYLIKENDVIVYVGHSKTQLYKTITRHFHKWEHTSKQVTYDVWAKDYKIKIIQTPKSEAKDLECKLINKHDPRDNTEKMQRCDNSEVPF